MNHIAQNARARALAALLVTVVVAGLTAPAGASSKTGGDERARQICQTVIRVQPGDSHFGECVSVLSDSLENIRRSRAVAQERDACFARDDLKAGSPEQNLCLLRAADAKPDAAFVDLPGSASLATALPDDPQSAKSYLAASFDTVLRRERQACALVGLDPAFGAFANCVANLQSTLQAANYSDG